VTCFTNQLICFELEFEHPERVSSNPIEKDELVVEILSTEYFIPYDNVKKFPAKIKEKRLRIQPQFAKKSDII